ncbi:phage protein [Pseudomonas phage PA02]|nr:phage protein [Pseudomonas phage PA02]
MSTTVSCLANALVNGINLIAKNKVQVGMILQATQDIWIMRTCKKNGYLEWKFANEGDDLTVLGVDEGNPEGGFRVLNADNYNQIETVQCTDMDDILHAYN